MKNSASSTRPSSERVVIVDDDHFIREIIRETVHRTLPRADVAEYDSAALAYSHVVDTGADLLITNCHMFDMDGPDLVRALRSGGQSLPIIMVSGSLEAMREGEAAGIDRFVPKDLVHAVLPSALLALLPPGPAQ